MSNLGLIYFYLYKFLVAENVCVHLFILDIVNDRFR